MASYSFADVAAAIAGPGGTFSLGSDAGAAEEGITVEFEEAANKMTIGAGGQGMQALNPSKAGKVTVRLLKTSPVNAQLTMLYNFQHESGAAAWGLNVLTVQDIARGDQYICAQGAFSKFPSNVYNKTGSTIEWVFDFVTIDPLLGAGLSL
jgi:hypothetical protein